MADDVAKSNSYNEQTVSLGEQLRRAREGKKLTTDKVAAQLRVKEEIITNLEAENWPALYGRTYARGYFINYVKYLGLPQNVLTASFNLHYQVEETTVNNEQFVANKPTRKKVMNSFLFAVSIMVISIMIYMFVAIDETNVASAKAEIEFNSTLTEEQSS